jgi:hypothetical protein
MQPGGSAYPPAPTQQPQQPHKKTGLFVAIIIAVVLVICLGLAIGGAALFKNYAETRYERETIVPGTTYNGDRDENGSENRGGNSTENRDENKDGDRDESGGSDLSLLKSEVVIDNDVLTFVVETSGGEVWDGLEWYVVDCTVENKTDKNFSMYFDFDFGLNGDYSPTGISILPDSGYETGFPAHKTIPAIIVFDGASEGHVISSVSNFTGTLIVYDHETFDTIAEYPVSIASM